MNKRNPAAVNAYGAPQSDLMPTISGLSYLGNFIDGKKCKAIVDIIDKQPWDCSLKRRVQQYGYRYDYSTSKLGEDDDIGVLPRWLQPTATAVAPFFCQEEVIQQAIVNDYLPGQGIASHIDHPDCFGKTVAILSLESLTVMDFVEPDAAQKVSMVLQPGSLLILQGESRFKWKHGIASRKSDQIQGVRVRRGRRVSLTFRSLAVSHCL